MKKLMGLIVAVSVAALAYAGPPAWKYKAVTLPAVTASYPLGVAGFELESVRASYISNRTNWLNVAVNVLAAADGWRHNVGTMHLTNTTATANYTNQVFYKACTNGWRGMPADLLDVAVDGAVTNGRVTVGYWYYE